MDTVYIVCFWLRVLTTFRFQSASNSSITSQPTTCNLQSRLHK